MVVTADLAPAGSVRVEANRGGYRQLRRFAAGWTDVRWAIEGGAGLGAPLAERLHADGITAVDVPAKLAVACGCSPPATAVRTTRPTRSRPGSRRGRRPPCGRWRSTRPSPPCVR